MLTITTVSPVTNTTVSGAVAWIASVAATNGRICQRVEFFVNNVKVYTAYEAPYAYGGLDSYWNSFAHPDGIYVLRAIAYDQYSQAYSTQVVVTVQNTNIGGGAQEIIAKLDPDVDPSLFVSSVLPVAHVFVEQNGKIRPSQKNCMVYVTSDRTVSIPEWINVTTHSVTGDPYAFGAKVSVAKLGFKFVIFKTPDAPKVMFDGFAVRYGE